MGPPSEARQFAVMLFSTLRSSWGRIGFGVNWSIPAARQVSRSPAIARAVMATIGMCSWLVASISRIAAVASRPFISGIWTSIRTTSKLSLR